MNSRERVNKALSKEMPDRVPMDLSWGFTPLFYEKFRQMTGETDYESYFNVDTRLIFQAETTGKNNYDRYFEGRQNTDGLTYSEWGVGSVRSRDSALHFERLVAPLQFAASVNDIADYPLPDYLAEYRTQDLKQRVEAVSSRGIAACAPLATTLFETAWQIRGFEEFCMDMADRPDMAQCLLDRIKGIRVGQAEHYVRAGVDVLILGDDVAMQTGMMISPAVWRRWLKPGMAEIIAAARAINPKIHVFYHSDGNPWQIIDELIEIGVTVLNPVQPECMDPAEVKKAYGNRLAFWGTIGVQSTLPFGTPEDVRREVRLRMDTVGWGGGLLIGPSHMIEPEVPWENMLAFRDAVQEFGWYR